MSVIIDESMTMWDIAINTSIMSATLLEAGTANCHNFTIKEKYRKEIKEIKEIEINKINKINK